MNNTASDERVTITPGSWFPDSLAAGAAAMAAHRRLVNGDQSGLVTAEIHTSAGVYAVFDDVESTICREDVTT